MKEFISRLLGREERPYTGDWRFDDLIKSLITISAPADRQRELIGGIGVVASEIASDFGDAYDSYPEFLRKQLITPLQKEGLANLDKFLKDRSGDKLPGFWDDEALNSHKDWKIARQMALKILTDIGRGNLDIEMTRKMEKTLSDKGDPIAIERTKTKLVLKK